MSDVILLRKLTAKSALWFGKYEGMSIRQIIELGKRGYLRWIYYHNSKIDFTDDILEAIRIKGDFIIEKPGRNEEKFEELHKIIKQIEKHLPINERSHNKKRASGVRLSRYINVRNQIRVSNKKCNLQAKNHGR